MAHQPAGHCMSVEENLLQKHKKERKELQAETARLKHGAPKGDKRKKKEVTAQIALLESQLDERQSRELEELSNTHGDPLADVTGGIIDISITENGTGEGHAGEAARPKKMSKAQKKREKKAAESRAREDMIQKQELENITGVRNVEARKIKEFLTKRNLVIREVPSDGNCLYTALELQLKSRDIKTSVVDLRHQCADFMRQEVDDFLPFLSKPDTGEPYSPDEFETYCKELESTPAWGGQPEITALSKVLRLPIEVIQADGPSVVAGEEYDTEPLLLTYHRHMFGLGEHYNAVVPRTAEDEEDEFS